MQNYSPADTYNNPESLFSCINLQVQMTDVKMKLEKVVKENEKLHAELRESVEKQLQALPVASGAEGSTLEEDDVIRSLQEQIQLSKQVSILWLLEIPDVKREVLILLYALTAVFSFSWCRQAKAELRTATAKVEEMTKLMQNVQDQMQRREEDAAEAQGREEAADRRLQQLQAALSQLEARLKAASQEAEAVRREQTVWERQVGELQGRCASLEEEKYEAQAKVRENLQLAEEATLQKEQALLREKQKSEELEKTKEAIKQLIQGAAVRTRKEVENAEWPSGPEQFCCLCRVYKEGRAEPEFSKMDALHQRCLDAERMKDDMGITLQSTQNKLKKMELDYSEELSRCQEEVRRLQGSLAAARDDCVSVSEERLQLQQENLQLRREMDELRKASLLAQKKAKQQVSQMEHEYSVKEQGLEARVQELEENSRSCSADLTRLLTAQQRSTNRWKEEAKNRTQAFETKITSLKAELNRQKQRSQELEVQLETDHSTIAEYERQLAEYQEKTSRLQRRLTQAEQRATTATQQLSMLTSQRRKTALVDPECVS
uniref:Sodium channel and clathrin linker 1 n=1 Tax=Myripristis murdjan TaxID=586833 RepID=A0A667WIH1_9TELE